MKMFVLVLLISVLASCASMPPVVKDRTDPVATDPEFDPAYPPRMASLKFEIAGSRLHGFLYQAAGPGPHPTVVLLHGFPGYEKNGDLAQAMRRAGTNVVTFSYRGTWGSEGTLNGRSPLEDVEHVIARIREPQWAAEYHSDPAKIGIVGHSFGGAVGALITMRDQGITCYAHLAGSDVGFDAGALRTSTELRGQVTKSLETLMVSSGGPVNGNASDVVESTMAAADYAGSLVAGASDLATRPLLLAAALRDESVSKSVYHDPLVAALREAGAKRLTEVVYDDDHAFSAHRVTLGRKLVEWQREQCWH